jgi:VWFA-related protein
MRISIKLFFGFLITFFVFALSEQTTAAQSVPPVNYSESKPYQPREFPANKNSKPKKEKKAKANNQNTNEKPDISNLPSKIDEAITIPVSVFDSNGRFVTNLKQSDFKVFVDGQEQEILSVDKHDQPVTVVLLIDISPSTAYKIEEIQNYTLAIVEKLKPDDKVMVIAFNEQTKLLADSTTDREIISKAVRKLKFGDGTSLYEAVKTTFNKYVNQISGKKAVILLTDGVDTTSRTVGYADSLLAVEKKDTSVFPIYFDTFATAQLPSKTSRIPFPIQDLFRNRPMQGTTADEYEIGKMYLNDISSLSGGRPYAVKDITDTRVENVNNISAELRLQYQIRFRSPSFTTGQRKQITVRINRPNLLVQARGSLIFY